MHYSYVAVKRTGRRVKGVLNAVDTADAIAQLQGQGLTAVSLVGENAKKSSPKSIWEMEIGSPDIHRAKLKKKKLLTLLNQMAIMMRAGVSLSMAMEVLISSESNKQARAILKEMNDDLYTGQPISASMAKFAAFPEVTVRIVQSGEANGRLDSAFERAADIVEKEIALTGKIKGAMGYPIFLLFLTLVLIIVMNAFVLPSFAGIFMQFGSELPDITKMVMGFSDFLVQDWYLLAGGAVILILSFVLARRHSERFAVFVDKITLRIPVVGEVMRRSYVARFCRIMGSLVEAGVEIVRSLEIAGDVIPNRFMRSQIAQVIADVKIGSSVNQSMAKYRVFDPLLVSMVRVGEESGMLFETLEKMGSLYEQQTDESVKRMTTLLEPAMTIVIAVVVGTVIISIVIPMFGMYDVISAG